MTVYSPPLEGICLAVNLLLSQGLISHHRVPHDGDLAVIKKFQDIVSQQLQQQCQFDEDNVMILAAAVDPRYHHLQFFNAEEQPKYGES